MYDKYDSPHDDEIYQKKPEEQAREILDKIKPFIVPAVAIIVLLIIGLFAYDFFVGSVKNVTFELNDTEGESISGAVKVLNESGGEIATARSGEAISLKAGTYTAQVAAANYKAKREQFNVTKDGSIEIEMESDKELEISGEFPGSFFTGEQKTIQVTITNNGETSQAKFVLENDAKEALEFENNEAITVVPGTNTIEIILKAKESPKSDLLGEENKGTIRIEGLNNRKAKIEGDFELIKFALKDISIRIGQSNSAVDFGTLKSGATSEKQITIQNKSDATINEVEAEITITSTIFADKTEVKNWFSFEPANVINDISPGETKSMTLNIQVPSDYAFPPGKTLETVNGNVILKTGFLEQQFNLNLKIQKPNTGVNISGINDKYTITKRDNVYPTQANFIDIRNTGDVLLTDFRVLVSCTEGYGWVIIGKNQTDTFFATLGAGQTRNIPYTITVPNSVQSGKISNCGIAVIYNDPANVE